MTGTIVVSTDLLGLYVNIAQIVQGLQPNIQEHHHVPLIGYAGSFDVKGGGKLYQVTIIDLDNKHGGGQKWVQEYVSDGEVLLLPISTQTGA
jgi:hypothetical protein